MKYRSLEACLVDLERHGQLVRIEDEVDPNLEMAEIHRRVFDRGGPALLFERVKGSPFRAASNLYGTFDRAEFLFRNTLAKVQKVVELKADPALLLKQTSKYLPALLTAWKGLPKRTGFRKSRFQKTSIDKLPQVVSWPEDGGAFITLPQVLTEPPGGKQIMHSNLGMYRIQMSGNQYLENQEVGMHYQLHRGIGVHHTAYNQSSLPFRVSIFVGGLPSHALAAIFPLPEGLSELTFAGMLAGKRFSYARYGGYVFSNDSDFIITGTIDKNLKKREGPFGDHLGYYSLAHDFPVVEVEQVYHRPGAIWHFTVVGRPPQEDTSFGHLIHKLVGPMLPQEFPGILDINAVDAAGVHPLLLAVGSERYMPFRDKRPEEILTQANHLLGSGQTSLAKYLLIAAHDPDHRIDTRDIRGFLRHILQRCDWKRDLHFQTNTTIDTLDYSGSGWNAGSKLIMACHGPVIRQLRQDLPLLSIPQIFGKIEMAQDGIMVIEGPGYQDQETGTLHVKKLISALESQNLDGIALLVIADDAVFTSQNLKNFLWITFTRSNPSHDVHGVHEFFEHKHWGCKGPLIIDARKKPHHAPELVPDRATTEKVDRLFANGGPLAHLE